MEIEKGFRTWPLGKQMQIVFLSSGFAICLVFVVITKLQMDWLRDMISEGSESVIENRVIDQMKALAQIEAKFIASELLNYVYTVSILHNTDLVFNNFTGLSYKSNPFVEGTAFSSSEVDAFSTNYSTGAYYSKYTLSEKGVDLTKVESCFNKIYPIMSLDQYSAFYQGYETDEIFNFYPAKQIVNSYTPLTGIWYYNAVNQNPDFFLTEPYADSSNDWVVSVSKALEYEDEIFGVVALNASLKLIIEKLNITIIDSGMALLIGKEGVILNLPDSWLIANNRYTRIFNQSITGISEKKWEEIKNEPDGTKFKFTDKNDVTYKAVMSSVNPGPFFNTSYYLMICAKSESLKDYGKTAYSRFSDVYETIFWVIFSIGLVGIILETISIFYISRKTSLQLTAIKRIFQSLLKGSLYPNKIHEINYKEINEKAEGFEDLVSACGVKLKKIEEFDSKKGVKTWKYSRPDDEFIIYEWMESRYPYNYYSGKTMAWRKSLNKLKLSKSK